MGPEGGTGGGKVAAQGTPEAIVKAKTSSAPAAKPSYTPPKPAAAPRAAAPAVTYNDPVDAPQASAKSTGHDADWETF